VKFLGQRIYCNSSIWPLHSKDNHSLVEYVIERGPKEFLFVEEDKKIPTYFVALASDGEQAIDDKNSLLADVSNELPGSRPDSSQNSRGCCEGCGA
jgi:hypothetical protein